MCQALYFLRHGATAEDPPLLKGQRIDPPLSPEGHARIQAWAEKLATIPFQAVIYTPTRRARETAFYFLAPSSKALELPHLVEISWGDWEGLPRTQAEPLLREQIQRWDRGDINWGPPQGESLKNFQDRLQAGYELILSLFPVGALLIIGHGYSLRVLLSWLLGYSPGAEGALFHHAPGTLSWGIRNPNGTFYLQSLAISPDDWVF